jgi:uncharacterized protein
MPQPQPKLNRLSRENSPYLLQHARNPVDWFPWGEEAFAKARAENKPIFLSAGYSTCHWCHVMERESFENPDIAAQLNRDFVCIKVDREERPDVDRAYMAYVQAATGGGGWPMSVWLTPDLHPFFGGTYFPPDDRGGRMGFPAVLRRIAAAWQTDRERIATCGQAVIDQLAEANEETGTATQPLPVLIDRVHAQFTETFDPVHGGFGGAPKFPRPSAPAFLLRRFAATADNDTLDMVLFTLRQMAAGGIHDHLGGGFHRYTVDARWHVPHFEKMLYDQAQLASLYLDAHQITGEPLFAEVARGILDYVRRDLAGPEGQFFSAEDADSPDPRSGAAAEGAFYLWTHEEIVRLLGDSSATRFSFAHGVEPGGNVPQDPHGDFAGRNILFGAHSVAETAGHFGLPVAQAESALADARRRLFDERAKRPRPHLDDKTLSGWNGLMISAFARAAQVLGETAYLDAARTAAAFLRDRLYDEPRGILLRRHRQGEAAIDGFADDYAFVIQGLLDLYEAGFDVRHLEWAIALQHKLDEDFWDAAAGGYFCTSGADPSILVRLKERHDSAEPSANSVALLNLLRLAQITGRDDFEKTADQLQAAFAADLEETPWALPQLAAAVQFAMAPPARIVIAGDPGADDTQALLRVVHESFHPHKVLLLATPELLQMFPHLRGLTPVEGQATAYVCLHQACQPPVTSPDALRQLLNA